MTVTAVGGEGVTATSTTGAESDSPFLHPSIPVRIGEHIEEKQGAAPPLPWRRLRLKDRESAASAAAGDRFPLIEECKNVIASDRSAAPIGICRELSDAPQNQFSDVEFTPVSTNCQRIEAAVSASLRS